MESPEEHILSSLYEVESQRIPEILDTIGCSQRLSVEKSFVHFCVSDKSILQCWSSFCFFEHCEVQPVFNQLLVSKPGCWPSKSGGIVVVTSLPAVYCNIESARYAPTNDSFDSYFVSGWDCHQNLPRNHSSLGLLKFSSNTHSRGTSFATRSSTFTTQPQRSFTTLWLLVCSFLWKTVRDEIQLTADKKPQNCKEFFLSWIVSDNEVKKI